MGSPIMGCWFGSSVMAAAVQSAPAGSRASTSSTRRSMVRAVAATLAATCHHQAQSAARSIERTSAESPKFTLREPNQALVPSTNRASFISHDASMSQLPVIGTLLLSIAVLQPILLSPQGQQSQFEPKFPVDSLRHGVRRQAKYITSG